MCILKTLQEENVQKNSLMGLTVFFFFQKKISRANSHTSVRKKKTLGANERTKSYYMPFNELNFFTKIRFLWLCCQFASNSTLRSLRVLWKWNSNKIFGILRKFEGGPNPHQLSQWTLFIIYIPIGVCLTGTKKWAMFY